MIIRNFLHVLLITTLIAFSHSEEADKFDTNDWIPIAQPRADKEVAVADEPVPLKEKTATGRVLNLADPPEANFFPDDSKQTRNNFQQFLRETTNVNPYSHKRQPSRHKSQPYRFENAPSSGRRPHTGRHPPPPQAPKFFAAQQPYHTIPEEYLTQQGLVQPQNLAFLQNFPSIGNIPDLPPIRLNASTQLQEKRKPIEITTPVPKEERENVQLLYVPLESLNQKPRLHAYQQIPHPEAQQSFSGTRNVGGKQQKIQEIENDFIKQALEAHKLQQQLQFQPPQFVRQPQPQPQLQQQLQPQQLGPQHLAPQQQLVQQQYYHEPQQYQIPFQQPFALPLVKVPSTTTTTTTTTRKPSVKKRKPHQPPLAVYMGGEKQADVADVLSVLKNAKSIEVQDTVGPNSPKIFVGPSTLQAPEGYSKFELPYLSSIDNNRVERKVDQLPFFVAPLSYKAPAGYSKIPLPSPHVGSVVVSTKEKLREKESLALPQYNQHSAPEVQYQKPSPVEDYTLRSVVSSTLKYSKPVPQEHIINQYELDQINSFIPQYYVQQTNQQQIPEKFLFDSFQPVQKKPEPTIEEYILKGADIGQKTKEEARPSAPLNAQEQFVQEVIPDNRDTYDTVQQTRNTHLSSTAAPVEQYHKEVSYDEVRPAYHRTRAKSTTPSTPSEQYYSHSRGPSRRTRPTTPTPIVTEQYLKETTSYDRPRSTTLEPYHDRPRQTTLDPYHDRPRQTTLDPYHDRPRQTTPDPYHNYQEEQHVYSSTPFPKQEFVVSSSPRNPYLPLDDSQPPKHVKGSNDHILLPPARPYQNIPVSTSTPSYADIDYDQRYSIFGNYNSKKPDFVREQPVYTPEVTTPHAQKQDDKILNRNPYDSTQHTLNQEALDDKVVGRNPYDSANYVQREEQYYVKNANVDHYNLPPELSPVNQVLPSLINNLEDQSVRQLLHPSLLRNPTSTAQEHVEVEPVSAVTAATSVPSPSPTTTTTPYPVTTHPTTTEATTTRRPTRGRQRGNRFSTTTQSSVQSTRKPVTRGRRPVTTRTRYQEDSSTEYTPVRSTTDPTKQIVTARSRFRTRGRPVQSDAAISDRISTTEKQYYDVHVSPSYTSTDRVSEDYSATPRITPNEQYIISNYQSPYSVTGRNEPVVYNIPTEHSRFDLSSQRISTYNTPVERVSTTDRSRSRGDYDNTSSRPTRVRSRVRARPKTTTTTTEAPRQLEEAKSDEEEFYGFFREPNFQKTNVEEEVTARPVYSSTYVSSTLKPNVQYVSESSSARYPEVSPSTAVQFLGEIRPKYQAVSTSEYYEATQPSSNLEAYHSVARESSDELPKVKPRTRVRVPGRQVSTTDRYGETTRREEAPRTPSRGRTRGKVHFKPAVQPKSRDSAEDEDVEGGNYPPQFKAAQSVTSRPSFQISVEPNLDDQDPYASIFRPTYVAKEAGAKDQLAWDPTYAIYQSVNDIQNDHRATTSDPAPFSVISDIEAAYDKYANVSTANATEAVPTEPEEVATTTLIPEATTKKRRGVWKLIKKPLDEFETAESQNIGNVKINSFDVDDKPKSAEVETEAPANKSEEVETTTDGGFLNSLYEMFGISENAPKEDPVEPTTNPPVEDTTLPFVEETTISEDSYYDSTDAPTLQPSAEEEPPHTTQPTFLSFVTPMTYETWNQGVIKTSTSTEISHETEICYKGKCIKSKDMKVPMT